MTYNKQSRYINALVEIGIGTKHELWIILIVSYSYCKKQNECIIKKLQAWISKAGGLQTPPESDLRRDVFEEVTQIGVWFQPVDLGGFDQAVVSENENPCPAHCPNRADHRGSGKEGHKLTLVSIEIGRGFGSLHRIRKEPVFPPYHEKIDGVLIAVSDAEEMLLGISFGLCLFRVYGGSQERRG